MILDVAIRGIQINDESVNETLTLQVEFVRIAKNTEPPIKSAAISSIEIPEFFAEYSTRFVASAMLDSFRACQKIVLFYCSFFCLQIDENDLTNFSKLTDFTRLPIKIFGRYSHL